MPQRRRGSARALTAYPECLTLRALARPLGREKRRGIVIEDKEEALHECALTTTDTYVLTAMPYVAYTRTRGGACEESNLVPNSSNSKLRCVVFV